MIGITNAGGSGAGCKLTVTAPAGAAITVTNTAGKVKSKTVGANGLAVFRGLTEGDWTITITNGTDTASKTVKIKADYQAEITFFSATINITYPAGLTCTATDGVTTLTAPDTSGTWACVVPNAGTWTITAGEWSGEAVITATGQTETVRLARWIVKSGVPTDIGFDTRMISGNAITKSDGNGYIQITPTGGYAAGILSDVALNMNVVKTVVADVDITNIRTDANYANFKGVGLALADNKEYTGTSKANSGIAHIALTTVKGRQTLSIDAEGITGDWYVGISMQQQCVVNIYDMWLEV